MFFYVLYDIHLLSIGNGKTDGLKFGIKNMNSKWNILVQQVWIWYEVSLNDLEVSFLLFGTTCSVILLGTSVVNVHNFVLNANLNNSFCYR